ncbi:MAG: flagellar biosynthesis protein FliQ [Deltaproteobacteria bacterium]|nr:flagellar biosynthesis protein FliQ [Deltaproteobacteria bacterium]
MTPETVIDILRSAVQAGGTIVAPVLFIGLATGVLVSVLQAATQINDQTLVIVPKIVVTLLTLMILGSWMLQMYLDFMRSLFLNLPQFVK